MSRPLRILHLVQAYPPALGGVQQAHSAICERLVSDHGCEVTVLTTNAVTALSFRDRSIPVLPILPSEMRNGVKIRRFSVDTRWAPLLKYPKAIAYRWRLPGNSRLRTLWTGPISSGLLHATRTEPADVISAGTFPFNHLTYPFRRREPRLPVILLPSIHIDNSWEYHRADLIGLVKRSYATVASTESERRWLIEQHNIPAERLRVIGFGVDLKNLRPQLNGFRVRFGIPERAPIIAYVGPHSHIKGIETLIESFPHVLTMHHNAHLIIAGAQTALSSSLELLIEALPDPVRARVLFLRDISEELKAEILSECDVFASPSFEESFGVTIIEAWAYEKPVVVGNSPGQRSVVRDGELALVITPGNKDELAYALIRLLEDEPLRARLGRAGREEAASRYDLPNVVAEYYALFAEAAASAKGGSPV